MFKKWWAEWKRRKREKWEMSQLSDEQKDKYFSDGYKAVLSKDKQIYILTKRMERLEAKFDLLKQMVLDKKSEKRNWRVSQDRNGQTEWMRAGEPKYVSPIYSAQPNEFCFDAIIDGQKITFTEKTMEDAESRKLKLLDVERIEEYDEQMQNDITSKTVQNDK